MQNTIYPFGNNLFNQALIQKNVGGARTEEERDPFSPVLGTAPGRHLINNLLNVVAGLNYLGGGGSLHNRLYAVLLYVIEYSGVHRHQDLKRIYPLKSSLNMSFLGACTLRVARFLKKVFNQHQGKTKRECNFTLTNLPPKIQEVEVVTGLPNRLTKYACGGGRITCHAQIRGATLPARFEARSSLTSNTLTANALPLTGVAPQPSSRTAAPTAWGGTVAKKATRRQALTRALVELWGLRPPAPQIPQSRRPRE